MNANRYPPLSQEQISNLFTIDFAAGKVFWKNVAKEHARLNGQEAGAPRVSTKPYWVIKVQKRAYRRAQIILAAATGVWPAECVDHISGDSLDDRPENLRHATVSQNAMNHKSRAKKAPEPMGVRLTASGKYQARIALNKRQLVIGVFESAGAASAAYQAARKEMFREFA